jgi:hypothetical protein
MGMWFLLGWLTAIVLGKGGPTLGPGETRHNAQRIARCSSSAAHGTCCSTPCLLPGHGCLLLGCRGALWGHLLVAAGRERSKLLLEMARHCFANVLLGFMAQLGFNSSMA